MFRQNFSEGIREAAFIKRSKTSERREKNDGAKTCHVFLLTATRDGFWVVRNIDF